MAWLYLARELSEAPALGAEVQLTGDDARHAAQVARVRRGERISIGNGRGLVLTGTVVSASAREVVIRVDAQRLDAEAAPRLVLAQALAKGDRDELAVEAATELGVSGVIPWAAERSVSRWEGMKITTGQQRWAAKTSEAAKQAIRAWVPTVEPLTTAAGLAEKGASLIVLDPMATERLSSVTLPAEEIVLVVGPEGGISPRELELFDSAGATRVRLGSEVLRTSTAGPAGLAVLNARLGRW